MESETIDIGETGVLNKRPTFLTVLCILTFIVSGYNFVFSLLGLFQSKSYDASGMEDAVSKLKDAAQSADDRTQHFLMRIIDSLSITIQAGVEHATALGLVELLVSAGSIIGAYFMFRLQKAGYYTYIVAKIFGIIVPLTLLGFNLLTGMIYGFAVVVGAIFVVLYGVNRKYMH